MSLTKIFSVHIYNGHGDDPDHRCDCCGVARRDNDALDAIAVRKHAESLQQMKSNGDDT